MIVPLYKGKGEITECKNYGVISLLSRVGKLYVGSLVDRVCRVTGGLIDSDERGFRAGRAEVIINQIFTLNKIGDKIG